LATVARVCEEHPSWVSLSGSLPPGPVPEALGDLVTAAKGAGARVAVDTHHRLPPQGRGGSTQGH
jgi:fructose-1-phosphate kinase PfkB-like protein